MQVAFNHGHTRRLFHMSAWKPDKPDHRDHFVDAVAGLPTQMDLSPHCGPIQDQGELGSCTANASTSALEFLELKKSSLVVDGKRITVGMLSRLFVYYNSRLIEGTVKEDSGAEIRDVMKALKNQGVCVEALDPYKIARFKIKPSASAYADASHHKVTQYLRCKTLDALKTSIADGYPVVIGFSVPENMQSQEAAQTGIIKFPSPTEKIIGGHCVLAVGYNDSAGFVEFQNSWGTGWGSDGFGYLPYEFWNQKLVSDCWTIRKDTF